MSWQSTRSYYERLNQLHALQEGPWQQPPLLIDSLDFSEIVTAQGRGDWTATGEILSESARRLERAGATVLAIAANTMHVNYDVVASSVSVPVIDIRDAVVGELRALKADSMVLLGTKFLMERDFYVDFLEDAGVTVIRPVQSQIDELQQMIYGELTQGMVSLSSRDRFIEIANDCRSRGGDVVGLCCTEFGLYINESGAPWPFIDSTTAHVSALLNY